MSANSTTPAASQRPRVPCGFGSLLGGFGSLLGGFGSLLDGFGSLLVGFGSLLLGPPCLVGTASLNGRL